MLKDEHALNTSYFDEKSCLHKLSILSINDPRKTNWDLYVMVLATINVLLVPIDVGFEPESFQTIQFKIFNYFIDFIFFVDILVSFRTSYINPRTGAEVLNIKYVAQNYIKTSFTVDLLATIPFDTVGQASFNSENATFKIFGALKLVRVLRLSKIIAYLRATEEIKAFLKLIKLVFFLMIYMHCLACIWWMIVSREETWISQLSFNDDDLYFVYK